MSTNRAGEDGSIPNRSGRFLEKSGYWYYMTREGVDIGPFDTREDAAAASASLPGVLGIRQPWIRSYESF